MIDFAPSEPEFVWTGTKPYHAVRALQSQFISDLKGGLDGEKVIFCEHSPAVFTAGKRYCVGDTGSLDSGSLNGCDLVQVSRGGLIAWHGPGVLMMYPVVSLARRTIGVSRFVELGLESIRRFLEICGLTSVIDMKRTGVWLQGGLGKSEKAKIAFVGLRIEKGITDHGFSVNINCDLGVFETFSPCGELNPIVTSLQSNTREKSYSLEQLAHIWYQCFVLLLGDRTE